MLLSSVQNPKVSLSYSTSYSGPIPWKAASLSLTQHSITQNQIQRKHSVTQNQIQRRLTRIKCSISQIHSYRTVDYEHRPMLKWNAIYKRISLMKKPELGSGTVLTQWEREGRQLFKWKLCRVIKELRKCKCYDRALEVIRKRKK